ncbi:MAG: 7-cyano-7-deazaguanine synthase [Desulfobulbaceae bacterium]|nr:7-cyano-7-deazaguanine synthase [Desulfobulbaceae bacterium]
MKLAAAIGLFSGGLDSITACRVIMAQSIRVVALKFVTPFFDDRLLSREQEYRTEVREKYGIDVRIVDLSEGYIELLRNPGHGFGKNFNPCIDCKIFMLTRARRLMAQYGASFLFTGEVIGQRPMSQRRDTLRVIERESRCEDILLRPLCARLLKETRPEREGLVDRQRLYAFSGRGRRQQIELAGQFGITDYPSPAGGCILTDVNLGARIENFYQGRLRISSGGFDADDIRLLLVGRQFRLPGGQWFVLGRDEKENERLLELAGEGDAILYMRERPGPTGLLRMGRNSAGTGALANETIMQAAGLVVRYGRKVDGRVMPAEVSFTQRNVKKSFVAEPLGDDQFSGWQL